MAGTTRRLAPCVVALALLLGASGCGGPEQPSPRVAGDQLAAWMSALGETLAKGVQPLKPWTPVGRGTAEQTTGCGDGEERRSYTATLDVPDSGRLDSGNRANLLAGQLGQAGWTPSTPKTDASSGSFTARRSTSDSTGSTLALEYAAVPGGWHYRVAARTACLETP
jgi:hypothetical protein